MRTATSKRSSGGIRSSSKNSAARVSCCVASSHQHRCFQRTKGGRSFSMAIIYHSSGTLDRRSAVFDVHLVSAPSDELPRYIGRRQLQLRKSPKPVRWVRTNACPILMPSEAATDIAKAKQLGAQELQRRSSVYRTNRSLRDRLVNVALGDREPRTQSIHVEEQMYDGFFSDDDQQVMLAFHNADWAHHFELSQQLKDARLQKIAQRVLFAEAPECLPAEIRFAQEREFAHRLIAEQAEWLTLPKAIKQTEDLLKAANEQSKPFLLEYRAYLGRRLKQAITKAA